MPMQGQQEPQRPRIGASESGTPIRITKAKTLHGSPKRPETEEHASQILPFTCAYKSLALYPRARVPHRTTGTSSAKQPPRRETGPRQIKDLGDTHDTVIKQAPRSHDDSQAMITIASPQRDLG
ncbi:hypothetical protein CRG98_012056 [Punica granatum]|uniref:Uncharacterized protein n=1 Tax=Punica granatum TaxID=22663 RepID=A0A2I0KG51_PUNGR|nr:hypothetical protein CRG98_012056 [Punica granatum]